MEAEVIVAITTGSAGVVIACVAAVIAIFSCKYSRQKKSQTDQEATQVELIHEQCAFKFAFIKYNSKKDNTFINNGSLSALNESSTSWETKNSETANALANGGIGEALDFVSRGIETGAKVYTAHKQNKTVRSTKGPQEEEGLVEEYSATDVEEHEILVDDSATANNSSTPRPVPPTPRPAPNALAEFLALQTPENAGKGSEMFIAKLAQPPTAHSNTPRQKELSSKDKKVVEPAANRWWSLTSKKKKKEEEKKEKPNLEVSQASSSDLNQNNNISTSQSDISTDSQHKSVRHQSATRKESSLKKEQKEPSRVSNVKFEDLHIDSTELIDPVEENISLSGNTSSNIEENI